VAQGVARLATGILADGDTDADLGELDTLWPTLSAPIKAAIMAMVRAYSSVAVG
jgi:hypothetical protein